MSQIQSPKCDNLNDLMYWLELISETSTPREELCNDLTFNFPQIEITLRSEARHLLENLLLKRNVVGAKWEKLGYIGLAITAYEKNIKDGCRGDFPYERLRVLYSKLGLYEKAINSCKAFLALPNHPMGYDEIKRIRFQEYIEKISINSKSKKNDTVSIPLVLIDSFEECKIPEILLNATKVSSKHGKAKYKLANNKEGTIENFVLEHFLQNGYSGFWSENDYWWMLMSLLFWDIIFYPIPGMFFIKKGLPLQDMPMDFFNIDFFIRREENINKLLSAFNNMNKLEKDELIEILENYYNNKSYQPCRSINNWDKFSLNDLKFALKVLSPSQIVKIMARLIFYFGEFRKGLPDLFLVKDNEPVFIECKEMNEEISIWQKSWHKYITTQMGIPVKICRIKNSS